MAAGGDCICRASLRNGTESNHCLLLLCGPRGEYRHWSSRAGPDQAQRPIGPNSTHRALQISRVARVSHKSTATVRYATSAPDLSKPSRAAPQRAMTAAHRRCRHDAASSMQAGDAEAQGAARVTNVHCMCRANGHTLHATGNMRDPTHVEAAIKWRIRPEPRPTFVCAGGGAGEAAGSSGSAPVAQSTRALRSVSCSGPPRRAISQH